MDYKKARIGDRMMAVISLEDYMTLDESLLNGAAVEANIDGKGYVLPILPTKVSGIGINSDSKDDPFSTIRLPLDDEYEEYSSDRIIDFSSSSDIEDLMKKQKEFIEQEKDILMNSKEEITLLDIDENDSCAMKAMKEAVNSKNIDIDLYKDRYGNNFANVKRKLKGNDITLKMMNQIADGLDMKVSLIVSNKDGDIANPMPKDIKIELGSDVK